MKRTHPRLSPFALVLGLAAACSNTSDFCTESVIVPPSKLGTCDASAMGYPVTDAGLVLLSFPDLAACESGRKASCSSQDQKDISDTISCENDKISGAPSCMSGQELTWVNSYVLTPCSGSGAPSSACTQAVGLTP
jgi:hypothetical protein